MANNIRDSGRARGRPFKPREPYTQRLRKILEEYPDGSQILREILQNSDDAKSSHQIFILDHNTYSSNKLFEPELNGYSRTNLKLDRYQGPALLALNNTIFEERDFQSLLKLADSEKRDQFDKIGVMGVGFNSIYHITDSPSFITGDKYVILDPHEWYFSGGVQFDFVDDNLAQMYPDQFAPFVIPSVNISYNRTYEGTIFRYPLRTKQDSIDSDISKKVYSPQEILDTFYNFYKNESTNSILFLKYIEKITFFELKQGAAEPNFLFTIELTNANEVREQRRLIAENIVPMMNSLTSKEQSKKELVTSYVASFGRQRGNSDIPDENCSWLILNYLDDLQETEKHFKNKFEKNIADYKFVPNVGLAVNLNDLNAVGRLFCFLPLPISMPFSISVNGYFAVSTNRRSLWTVADNEDLAADAIARLKVSWNQYLFENVLPKAWVRFLRELPFKVPKIQSGDMYKFWPICTHDTGSMSNFCKDLLKNVIENLDVKDKVFEGPSLTNSSVFEGSEFYWLSLSNGFFDGSSNDVSKIIQKIGFPVISTPLTHHSIIEFIKTSKLEHSLTLLSPYNVRDYLKKNIDRWQDKMSRSDVLQVFKYVFTDKNFDKLEGFKIIPLANETLGTLTKYSDSYIYIGPNDNSTVNKNDEFYVFKDHLNRFIDKNIDPGLYKSFYSMTASTWNLNIKVLDALDVIEMIKFTLKSENVDSEEMQISKHYAWIHKLWENLNYRRWDLKEFENVHLIPTSRNTLRKLKTPKKVFLNHSTTYLKTIFEKFGAVFVESRFEKTAEFPELSPYIIKPDNMILVLKSFQADTSYPNNLNHKLQVHEATALLDHLSNYFRVNYKNRHLSKFEEVNEVIEVIKHLPIFTEVDNTSKISLLPDLSENETKWFLLPLYEENSYGRIICPSDKGRFLNSSSQNLRYILEDMIKIPRLDSDDYWLNYVIPFLESQRPAVRDVVIDKLFEHDNLKSSLMNISFVPIGTFGMSKNLQLPINVRLVKPSDLFDPEEKALVDLFFEDEQFFPTGNYGISKELPSKKFLLNLRLLGMKSILSSNDVVSRIQTIVARKQGSKFHVNSIRIHALKLFKYLDDNWSKLTENDDQEFLNAILENEWIPTIDKSGNEIFSKPQDCYCQKVKYL
ncbi:5338_t:CDS:2, partial [Funneliformis caledonium]